MSGVARTLLAGLCLVVVCLTITGALYQTISTRRDAQRFPRRGHLVQAGSIHMNIDCSGQGSPTVILESGSGGPSVDWLMVQPEVARFSRVCSYDRAGYGWSDSGPEPRSSLQIARELKQLLQAAGEKGPYVLVGHSMGGYDIRTYTGQYPNDVVGMVLVDASHEDQEVRAPESIRKWLQDYRKHPGWKKLKYFFQLHLGWARLMADRDAPAFWPKAFREEEDFLTLSAKHQFATIDEDQVFSTLSAAQVRSAGKLGDRPLVVLTATRQDDIPAEIPPKDAEAEEDLWVHQLQPELARLSTRSKQIVVESSHELPTEHPEIVISAIHDVWLAVHKRGGKQPSTP
ncbi:MAG TPA: alpha/beta hydrolase [Terriglobales bacterium]|nr:alpha/beta hydrolase [Terriglobales bacterium]